jgi:hypothetical protein
MDPHSKLAPLKVQVSFETTRLSAQCLADAYDRLVPIQICRLRPAWEPENGAGEAQKSIRRSDHA